MRTTFKPTVVLGKRLRTPWVCSWTNRTSPEHVDLLCRVGLRAYKDILAFCALPHVSSRFSISRTGRQVVYPTDSTDDRGATELLAGLVLSVELRQPLDPRPASIEVSNRVSHGVYWILWLPCSSV